MIHLLRMSLHLLKIIIPKMAIIRPTKLELPELKLTESSLNDICTRENANCILCYQSLKMKFDYNYKLIIKMTGWY